MELTLDQLLAGKPTKIRTKDYFPTKAYVEPFLDFMVNLLMILEYKLSYQTKLLVQLMEKLTLMILLIIEYGFKQ